MLHMLHVFQRYVVSVLEICCKRLFKMFNLFHTYVASVLSRCCICFNGYTHMLQASIQNISSVSDVCCKRFHLDVAYVLVAIHIC